jgi:hypothetical protein
MRSSALARRHIKPTKKRRKTSKKPEPYIAYTSAGGAKVRRKPNIDLSGGTHIGGTSSQLPASAS